MRIVLHIDMDAFFASVEERDKPRLKGLPIVVGADPKGGKGRGVVSTANYVARKYGIKSALPISRAWDLSQQAKRAGKPEAVFMEVDGRRYGQVSREIMAYLATKADRFQAASVDEAYLDISSAGSYAKARVLAQEIKEDIKKNQNLTCSIGIGPNKLIAKIAAQEEKPDGLTLVREAEAQKFLDPKSVSVLPGIGPKSAAVLARENIMKVSDLRQLSQEALQEKFGKWGVAMYRKARGLDDSPVEGGGEAKSIGEQHTFEKDTLDAPTLLATFKEIAQGVFHYLKRDGMKFRTVAITVRFSDFTTISRAHTLATAVQDLQVLETEAMKLLLPFLDSRENPQRKKIRLIGIRVEKLE